MADNTEALPTTDAGEPSVPEEHASSLPTEAYVADLERQVEEAAGRVRELTTRFTADPRSATGMLNGRQLAQARDQHSRVSRAAVAARARLDMHQAARAEAATAAMVEANKDMASASREAARASAQAARWAKWAAIFTALAAAASAYQAYKTGH